MTLPQMKRKQKKMAARHLLDAEQLDLLGNKVKRHAVTTAAKATAKATKTLV